VWRSDQERPGNRITGRSRDGVVRAGPLFVALTDTPVRDFDQMKFLSMLAERSVELLER